MPKLPVFITLATMLALSSCGPAQIQAARQRQIAQQQAIFEATSDRCDIEFPRGPSDRYLAAAFFRCLLAAAPLDQRDGDIRVPTAQRMVTLAERWRGGAINDEQYVQQVTELDRDFRRYIDDRSARNRIVAAQEQQARGINCMSTRFNNRTADNSGLNSTSGVVAIISLLGVIGGAVSEINACN